MEKARAARRAARAAADGQTAGQMGLTAEAVRPAPASVAPVSAAPAPGPVAAPEPPPLSSPEVEDWRRLQAIVLPPQLAPRRRLGALMGPEHAAPYDLLRTRVLRQMTEAKWTRLAITSPNKGCGKSTVSLNLALSLARQPDLRIILMDFDLRRPALARMLNHSRPDNMALLLEGGIDFADHAVRFGANLALGLNHHGVRHSSELLQAARTAEILDAIAARWKPDVMLFDMPPLQGNDDSLGFLGRVDAALLVAAAGATALAQIDTCEKELAAVTNVLGVVLNKCRYLGSEPGYDAYY